MVDRVIAITGTSHGIGLEIADYYSTHGDRVVGCSRSSRTSSSNYEHSEIDISEPSSVVSWFDSIRESHRKIDVLINNAALYVEGFAMLTDTESTQAVFNTNIVGLMTCSREAAKIMMRERFGRIINLSTIAVPLAPHGTSLYGASKAAVEQFTKVFAKEVFSMGITCNTLSLSVVGNTGMANRLSENAIQTLKERLSVPDPITVVDVINAIDFLSSPSSQAVNGQIIRLGGP